MYRVIWQYHTSAIGPWGSELLAAAPLTPSANLFGDLTLLGDPEPVFDRPALSLRAEARFLGLSDEGDETLDLAGYYHAFAPDRANAERLRDRLAGETDVRAVEIQERPTPALGPEPTARGLRATTGFLSLNPQPTPDFEPHQTYLDPAPAGIDARAAWARPGGRGTGVRVIDVEDGWSFTHEDLVGGQIGVVHGLNQGDDHGTAVLGVVSGDVNAFGITGIAPEAEVGAVSAIYDFVHRKWNVENAIQKALGFLGPGDVLMLEMHAPGPHATGSGQRGFVPVSFWDVDRAAIRTAIARGVYVVEAAGNGGEDLDHPVYAGKLARAADTGAILVGAGASSRQPAPRSRLGFSNWGSRLDLQGWGGDVVTTGGRSHPRYRDLHDHPDPDRCYTQSFAGTSSATPIVAGAVAAIAGAVKATGRPPLSPRNMRQLLIDTGTPQGGAEPIGPLPNLEAALAALGL